VSNASPSPWMFPHDFLTDTQPQELTARIVKAKLLEHVPQDIPYSLKPQVEYWDQKASGTVPQNAMISIS
jgi:GTP-binding protein Era